MLDAVQTRSVILKGRVSALAARVAYEAMTGAPIPGDLPYDDAGAAVVAQHGEAGARAMRAISLAVTMARHDTGAVPDDAAALRMGRDAWIKARFRPEFWPLPIAG